MKALDLLDVTLGLLMVKCMLLLVVCFMYLNSPLIISVIAFAELNSFCAASICGLICSHLQLSKLFAWSLPVFVQSAFLTCS